MVVGQYFCFNSSGDRFSRSEGKSSKPNLDNRLVKAGVTNLINFPACAWNRAGSLACPCGFWFSGTELLNVSVLKDCKLN